jgi:hypothetical protein
MGISFHFIGQSEHVGACWSMSEKYDICSIMSSKNAALLPAMIPKG